MTSNEHIKTSMYYIYIYSDIFSIYAFDQAQLFWRGDPLLKMIQTSAAWPPCQKPIWACHMSLFVPTGFQFGNVSIVVSVVVGNPNILQHIPTYSNPNRLWTHKKPHQVGSKNRVLIGKHRSMVSIFCIHFLAARSPCSHVACCSRHWFSVDVPRAANWS